MSMFKKVVCVLLLLVAAFADNMWFTNETFPSAEHKEKLESGTGGPYTYRYWRVCVICLYCCLLFIFLQKFPGTFDVQPVWSPFLRHCLRWLLH